MKKNIKLTENQIKLIINNILEQNKIPLIKPSSRATSDATQVQRNPLSIKAEVDIEIEKLMKEYPCIPKKNINTDAGKKVVSVKSETLYGIYSVILFIRKNKEKILGTFGCDEKTLVFLFKLAIAVGDLQTGLGTTFQSNEKRNRNLVKFDTFVSQLVSSIFGQDVIANPAMAAGKQYQKWKLGKGKEASIGMYQMQPQNYANATRTHKITGRSPINANNIFTDYISSTLSVMEYFLRNYRKVKTLNKFTGPSVDLDNKPIQGLTGDYNWDISIASYDFDFDNNLSPAYCQTNDPKWPVKCKSNNPVYLTLDTVQKKMKIMNVPYPKSAIVGKDRYLNVNKNKILRNYFPTLKSGSATTVTRVRWYFNYINTNLSCIKSF